MSTAGGAEGYALRGGAAGAERLRVLAGVHGPPTRALLDALGLVRGMRCLDVGCGTGEVALALAARVAPEGWVDGIDLDAGYVAQAQETARARGLPAGFVQGRAEALATRAGYDLVYARCLLSHLPDPDAVLAAMVGAARPGGLVALEDVDFDGLFCDPPSAAVARYAELYRAVVAQRGGDATRGRRLPRMLLGAGLEGVEVSVAAVAHLRGEGKRLGLLTLEHLRDAVAGAGLATETELDALAEELGAYVNDPATLMGGPRIVQAWGRSPGSR